MRKYFIGAAVGLVVVVIALVAVRQHTHHPQQKIYQSSYTATNIQFPYLANSQTVDFFTGSAFAAYNLTNHTTKTLSPELSLPTISTMRWSSTGVLFEASDSTAADDLYPAASAFELDPTQEYWWLYNFATQQISYVTAGGRSATVTDAIWAAGSSGQYDYVAGKTVLSSTGSTLFTDPSGVGQLEYASPTAVIYETTNTSPVLKERNLTKGTTATILTGAVKDITVTSSGNYVVYVDGYNTKASGDTSGDLELLDLNSRKISQIMSGYEGVTSLNNDGTLLISSQSGSVAPQLLRYSPTTGKLAILSSSELDQSHTAVSLWVIDANNYLVDSASNLLTVFRDQPATQPIYPNYDYLIQGDIYQTGFEIHYRSDNGIEVYNIYITQNPYAQYQQAALQYIRKQKIDPNFINIKWYSDDGITRPTYANATVPPGYFSGE